jgi:hypothetical protein
VGETGLCKNSVSAHHTRIFASEEELGYAGEKRAKVLLLASYQEIHVKFWRDSQTRLPRSAFRRYWPIGVVAICPPVCLKAMAGRRRKNSVNLIMLCCLSPLAREIRK